MLSLLIATILRPSLRVEVAQLSILGVGAITDNRLKSRVGDAGQAFAPSLPVLGDYLRLKFLRKPLYKRASV